MREIFRRNRYPIEAVQAFVSDRDRNGQISLDAATNTNGT